MVVTRGDGKKLRAILADSQEAKRKTSIGGEMSMQ